MTNLNSLSVTATGHAQKQAWSERATPPVEEVRPGLWSIPIDFAHSPIRYTFCYLVTNSDGEAIVIDPGGDSVAGRAQFQAGLDLAGISRESILGVVSTHFHIDHLGMVGYVAAASGGWIGMHAHDASALDAFADTEQAILADDHWLRNAGVPAEMRGTLVFTPAQVAESATMAQPTRYLADGERLPLAGRALTVVFTPGHTPGHICVVDDDNNVVFTGDHILPRITPNVGFAPTPERRYALSQYYRSLKRMAEWPDYEALPAHEYRFRGLADRAIELAAHHDERSAEILGVLDKGSVSTLWELGPRVSWSRGWESLDGVNLRAALSELAAHVHHLVDRGDLEDVTRSSSPFVFRRGR